MPIIEAKNLTYKYCTGTTYERKALDNITFKVETGDVIGIIGENGSGKSTLIKHLNGILQPTDGSIKIFGKDICDKRYRNELWEKVGIVFQFPEQQTFEDTVFNEIAYGLKNLQVSKEEIPVRVKSSLEKVGLEYESIISISPLSLSGGIRRRVAVASILAMEPEILILDECTAGLDLLGREKIIDIIKKIKKESKTTIIMVSHNISELIELCSHIAVLKDGKLISFGKTHQVLSEKNVQKMYFNMFPDYIQLMHKLSETFGNINAKSMYIEEIEMELHNLLKGFKDERN